MKRQVHGSWETRATCRQRNDTPDASLKPARLHAHESAYRFQPPVSASAPWAREPVAGRGGGGPFWMAPLPGLFRHGPQSAESLAKTCEPSRAKTK